MACLTYNGSYDQKPGLLNSILCWMDQQRYRISGPIREVYHRFNADELSHLNLPRSFLANREAEFVTELQIPVKPHPPEQDGHAQ